jgi:hypothetical protein
MVVIADIIAYISGFLTSLPYIVVFFFLWQQPFIHSTIKLFWLLGFCYGLLFPVQCVFLLHPEAFVKWYGLEVLGLTIFFNGLNHFVWGLEYFYSSENLI